MRTRWLRQIRLGLLTETLRVACITVSPARATVLYQTGFEPSEGYNTNLDLVGQRGWQGAGSGGNGIVSGFLPGTGHQAYVGFNPPLTNDSSLFIYQPINKRLPQVQFSVTFSILDSVSTTNRDEFYWSVFNRQGQALFTLDFNNVDLGVYYHLDGPNDWAFTGVSFTNDVAYRLSITMDYTSNRWSASLGGTLLATNQPITTVQAGLDLGDIDAAWIVEDPTAPGDNFMTFDDYRIEATAPAPTLKPLGLVNGAPAFRVSGLADNQFAIETSTNLFNWGILKTNTAPGGSFDFIGDPLVGTGRFYRARWVP